MQPHTMRTLPLVLALTLAGGLAVAQTATGSAATGTAASATGEQPAPAVQPATGTRKSDLGNTGPLARGDRKFIEEAAQGGLFEVQAGQLAANKAADDGVKTFANKLVEDHSAANNELGQLAKRKGLELPTAPGRGMRRELEKLGKHSGPEFDRMFVRQAVKDHQKDIKQFDQERGKVKDAELKAWIEKTLPHLREHLAMAQQLQAGGKNDAAAMGARGHTSSDIGTTPGGAATGTNTGNKTGS